ncbi:hypothetical protein V6238_11950 [Marinomonas arenicola]|uniref:tetratricopeptide repeat protein n=1 Tax=Marinomonas arenicola TaxID=569601 RepID=UPI00311D88B1
MAQPELAAKALMDELMPKCLDFYYQMGPLSALSEFEKARIERDIRVKIDDLSKRSKGFSHAAMMYLQVALGNIKEVKKEYLNTLNYLDSSGVHINYANSLHRLGNVKEAIEVLENYLNSNPPSVDVILLLKNIYRAIGMFSEDVKLMKTYSKLKVPQIDSNLPKALELKQYLADHDITQEETEHYFTIVNNYFYSQRINKFSSSRGILEDDEGESWISTRFNIEEDLTSEQIHSMNLGLLKLLAESDISDKASDHFVTSIF